MISFFRNFYFSSKPLVDSAFKEMCEGGTLLEHDERGIKVIQLTNGDILKVFRVKRLISGTNIYSYARRFCRNAKRLQALGIPTVNIKTLYHFNDSSNTAVLYAPLAGQTLRQLAQQDMMNVDLAKKLGQFLALLHQKGIHFYSLHTGNVVQTLDGGLGLIDISDLSIYSWPLFCHTRIRSFKRLCRYPEDLKKLGSELWMLLQQVYFNDASLSKLCELKIKQANSQLIDF